MLFSIKKVLLYLNLMVNHGISLSTILSIKPPILDKHCKEKNRNST
ncbi:MAG: hypothetical protein N3B21_03535 [Clostridia bacterium]|nr:hypothetical protein [Clostridia bacterium]